MTTGPPRGWIRPCRQSPPSCSGASPLAALGGGRPADALEHLWRIHDPADPAYHHAVRCSTIGDLAEAALHSGAPERIGVFVKEMEAAARQTPSPALQAGLRYAHALLASEGEAGLLFDTALKSDMSSLPFLQARVQLALRRVASSAEAGRGGPGIPARGP